MNIDAFGDESGIHKLGYECYGIGAFFLPSSDTPEVESRLAELFDRYNVTEELKWSRIGRFRATIEVSLEGLRMLLGSGYGFHAMVVEKRSFRKWKGDQEEAFYTSYYQFTRNICRRFPSPVRLFLDDRSDRYPHRAEVLRTVTNRALARISASGTVASVEKVDSKSHRILQLSDVLIGAITSDTNEYLGGQNSINSGKREVISRAAGLLGWDCLRYDTMPNTVLNVWHFPEDFRARPRTRAIRLSCSV